MDNVPVRVSNHASHGRTASTAPRENAPTPKSKQSLKKIIIAALAGLIAAALLATALFAVYRTSVGAQIQDDTYQAVFFTNGQVYFGKLDKLSGGYFKLSDIFYLQAENSENEDSTNPQEASAETSPDVQLVKLGGEIHGPQDAMIIGKDQVLFFENLKDDSTVARTIDEYHKNDK